MLSPSNSISPTSEPVEPPYVQCRRFLTGGVRGGELTLDVGCGSGELIVDLEGLGCSVIGTEIDLELIEACRERGLDVREGKAESLPFVDASFDRIVCSVVVPYTDERRAIAEWVRVLKPGGQVYATYHGVGYGLDYLVRGVDLRAHAYGARMLANSVYYWTTGRRLPGFYGDTLCQGIGRLRSYYKALGLVLEQERIASSFLAQPQFICHQLVKP